MRARVIGWLAFAFWVPALGAQGVTRSSTSKFFVGLGVNSTSIRVDGNNAQPENGNGVELQIGYGFTPRVALFVEATRANVTPIDDESGYLLSHADVGMRYTFATPASPWAPFLQLAATGRSTSDTDDDYETSGSALTVGVGFHYFFKPKVSFTVSLKMSAGEFDTIRGGPVRASGYELDATTTRMALGVAWFPKG